MKIMKPKSVTLKLTPDEVQAIVIALHWAESHEPENGEPPDPDFEVTRFKVLRQARGKLPEPK